MQYFFRRNFALLIVTALSSIHLTGSARVVCEAGCAELPPVVTNPGNQVSSVTESYGYAGAVLAAAPVGYWRMDDASGTAVSDWATAPQPGTTSGGITHSEPGALADGSVAMRFDGQIGTRVDIVDSSALELTTAVTVEAWVKGTTLSEPAAIVERSTPAGLSYRLAYGSGFWVFRVEGSFGGAQAQLLVQAADTDTWV
jgi:hypothetical protein